jgi:3-ketosteroid 9alpha-monooxygenase subunit B
MTITDSKKARLIKGVVVNAILETSDTWTLAIRVAEEDRHYRAGQFISIPPQQFPVLQDLVKYFEYKKGRKEPIRAYSLASAPYEDLVAITVKLEGFHEAPDSLPPLLSPLLASDLLLGKPIEFMGYTGGYVMPADASLDSDLVVHLVAGSGIVPSFSILKDELIGNKNPKLPHVLVYVNKSMDDIIYKSEIDKLATQFPKRLKVIHYLTRETGAPSGPGQYILSRPQISHMADIIKDPSRTLVYACGPAVTKFQKKEALITGVQPNPRFMEWVQDVVHELNIDKKRIHREVYG